MSNEWIDVKKKLPRVTENNNSVRVLAWAKGWFAPRIIYYSETIDYDDDDNPSKVYWWYNETSCYDPEDEPLIEEDGDILPTHWMPLPPPPKTK